MDEISTSVDQIVKSIKTKENNRRRKNKRRVQTLIDQFEKFDISSTPEAATDLGKLLCQDNELQEVLRAFVKELKVAPLLDFISDQEVRKSKGKQKATSGKSTIKQTKQTKSKPHTSSTSANNKSSPSKKTIGSLMKKKSLDFVPDKLVLKIEEAKKDINKNTWSLPMSDFSRDQIMSYVQGYFGAKRSEILQSIHRCEPTFTHMVSTAVKYWDDKQLIEPLLGMVEEVFKNSSDSEETYHWLVNEKVELAMVLMACFLRDEDILGRVLQTLYTATTVPFARYYDKVEEILLIAPYVLTSFKRIHTDSSSLLHVLYLMQSMAYSMQNMYNVEDIQKVRRWIVREGIVDVILMVNVHSKPSFEKMCPHIKDNVIQMSIFLTYWVKEEVNPMDILLIVPSILDLLNKPMLDQTSSLRTKMIASCSQLLQFIITEQLPFEQIVKLLDNDFIDKTIHAVGVHPTKEYEILDIFVYFVKAVPMGHSISHRNHQKLDKILEYMVYKMKQYTLPSNDLKVCLTQLFIISSVFMVTSKESWDKMIDDGTFRVLIQTFIKAEKLKINDRGKTKLEDRHKSFDTIQYFLATVQLITDKGGNELTTKVTRITEEFQPQISSLLNAAQGLV